VDPARHPRPRVGDRPGQGPDPEPAARARVAAGPHAEAPFFGLFKGANPAALTPQPKP
jgi:hypothetical protein